MSGPTSLEKVGRWVGDKLDWIMEEDDDWMEPWESEQGDSYRGRKRPLTAISLRVQNLNEAEHMTDNQWPDESSFRVDRWERDRDQVQQVNKFTGFADLSGSAFFCAFSFLSPTEFIVNV